MAKKFKLKTPEWILKGYDSEEKYNKTKGIENKKKAKTFKIRKCPECGSDNVKVVIAGEEGRGNNWECKKCGWIGQDIQKQEVSEEEFMKYLDEKGEEVS